jgi:hypothetical protein
MMPRHALSANPAGADANEQSSIANSQAGWALRRTEELGSSGRGTLAATEQ